MTTGTPDWLKSGRGARPAQRWGFTTDAPLTDVQLSRESGTLAAADESGGLYRLDRTGKITALTRTAHQIRLLSVADAGGSGVALLNDDTIAWFDAHLKFLWTKELPDEVVGLAMTAHGTHVIACLANGQNLVYDADKRKVTSFDSLRPLRFIRWLTTKPAFIAAADYGFFARYSWEGDAEWNERLWSSVSDLTVTGDGQMIILAGLAHGLQVYDADGDAKGSFVLEGTAHLVSMTYTRKRIAAATLERHLLFLDADGDVKWAVETPDDVTRLHTSALGDFVIVGFANGRIVRLDMAT
jgi:hypothetical protein